jgi:ABC-2 type transport system ATP-binding protein
MMNAIEVTDLTKSYSGFTLENLNFSLPTGSIIGLVGENGAGKSTTIKLLMNAISRDKGLVKILGVDNQQSEFISVKEDVGVVLDEAYFPELLTPKVVSRVMKYTYRNWDELCFSSYLAQFRLPETKEFKDFSRGMKMKLAIAVALSHNPRLLILDEATSGLDPIVRDELLNIFNDFTREESHSILLSSHIVSDLEKICDYIAFIHNGRLLFCEEKDKLLENYAIVRMSHNDFEVIPEEAVIGKKNSNYHIEALVQKSSISSAFRTEHTSLEDIILFLAREGK